VSLKGLDENKKRNIYNKYIRMRGIRVNPIDFSIIYHVLTGKVDVYLSRSIPISLKQIVESQINCPPGQSFLFLLVELREVECVTIGIILYFPRQLILV